MRRREFLKLTGTTSTVIALGLMACTRKNTFVLEPVPDADRIRIGLIGLGNRGTAILAALQNVPEFKVTAICDIFDFRIKKARGLVVDNANAYKDYHELLDNADLEAVIIATPLHEHSRMVIDALDKNLHVLCEKVLALTLDQCCEIKQKANNCSKLIQVSYQYQLNPMFQAIKELIQKQYLGKITRVECTWDRNNDWRRKLPSPDMANEVPASDLERIINWRMYRDYSGGLNAELGSHQFNMIENILGSHPEKVMGTGGIDYWKDGRETFDNVHVLFDHPAGVKVGFHSGTTNQYEGFQLKFYGTKATIVTQNMDKAQLYAENNTVNDDWEDEIDSITGASIKIIDKDKRRNINPAKMDDIIYPTDNFYYNTTWLLYKNFAAAIKGESELLLGIEEGYQSAITVHLANQAVRENKIVEWKNEYNV